MKALLVFLAKLVDLNFGSMNCHKTLKMRSVSLMSGNNKNVQKCIYIISLATLYYEYTMALIFIPLMHVIKIIVTITQFTRSQ